MDSSSEDEPLRTPRLDPQIQATSNDLKVKIVEFKGKLDPKEFLDWLHTVERVFEYKDIVEERRSSWLL